MSGTSLDGVDYALCTIDANAVRLDDLWHVSFPNNLRKRLGAAASGLAQAWEIAQLHHDLGRFYRDGAEQNCSTSRGRARFELVGLHGQTIFHQPAPPAPATFQLGEPSYLAERFGVPVVSNFRVADLAAGGQGAPLATAFHRQVFAMPGQHVCVNNLGGISNVTSLNWRRGAAPIIQSFDTGPANLPLDLAIHRLTRGRHSYDRNGRHATRGKVNQTLLETWLKHPFFRQEPPKSTGREQFGDAFVESILGDPVVRKMETDDVIASLTALTAYSLVLNYRLHLGSPPDAVILAGGGARNPVLCSTIARALVEAGIEATLITTETLGWPPESIEPAAFAWLAWLRWTGQPGNLPATTGASRPVWCGQVTHSPK